jgi:hypothetical protein
MAHHGLLTATEAGSLTISLNYTLSYSGVPIGDPDFFSHARAGLSVGNYADVNQQFAHKDFHLPPLSDPTNQQGTLSVSYLFNTGQSVPFSMFTIVNGQVPTPDMLWPTLAWLIGVALWWERRQRTDVSCGEPLKGASNR